jgi:hypothetical protein
MRGGPFGARPAPLHQPDVVCSVLAAPGTIALAILFRALLSVPLDGLSNLMPNEPFEPLTESQAGLVALLEAALARAKSGDITNFFWIAENTDGEYEQGFTPSENIYGLAGMALFSMMRQMGFVIKQDVEES